MKDYSMKIKEIRNQFKIYEKYPNLHYFDTAASSLKLTAVAEAISNYYLYNGTNVHRGVYRLAAEATNDFETTRDLVAKFINASPEEIVFTKGTSHSLNMLASSLKKNLKPGDEVITSQLEHHSSVLPWLVACQEVGAKLRFIPLDDDFKITVKNFKSVLNDKTKVVAITHVANTMGYLTPIVEITKLAHERDAIVILDAAQSIAHLPIDIKEVNVDYLAFSAHKMYGPNGVGILYGKKALLKKLEPSEYGGEMVFKIDNLTATWKDAPYKFETGTPAIADVIAFSEAIKFYNKIGYEEIIKHEYKLYKYVLDKIKELNGITVYNPKSDTPIILLNIDGVHPHDVASMLDQANIAVRAGHHCAQYVIAFLDEIATIRISFGIYNNLADCDALIQALIETRDFFLTF